MGINDRKGKRGRIRAVQKHILSRFVVERVFLHAKFNDTGGVLAGKYEHGCLLTTEDTYSPLN